MTTRRAGAGSFPRTAAVTALAKLGSARTWTEIATGLALPAAITGHTRGFLRRIRRTGRWPALLRQLTALAATLERDPPPIDYAARRAIDPDTVEGGCWSHSPSHSPTEDRLSALN